MSFEFDDVASEVTELVCVTDPSSPGLSTRTSMFVLLGSTCVAPEAADACCSLVAVWPSACTPSAAFAASVPTERSSIRAPTTHARSRLFISFSFSFRAFVAPTRRPAQGLRARRP